MGKKLSIFLILQQNNQNFYCEKKTLFLASFKCKVDNIIILNLDVYNSIDCYENKIFRISKLLEKIFATSLSDYPKVGDIVYLGEIIET